MIKDEIVALIPAYNPDEKMITMIDEIADVFDKIVVVNDGCDESYAPIFDAIKDKTTILVHEVNKGKGRALKTGLEYIRDNCSEYKGVVTADADGQHSTKDIINCCNTFLNEGSGSVFGCRDFSSDSDIPPRSRFGNQLTSRLLKSLCDIELSDTQTGLRVLPISNIQELIDVKGDRYEYEMNTIFALKKMDKMWKEVPIEVIYIDDNASSHFNPVKDSIRIYKVFVKYIFLKIWLFIKFLLSSLGSCVIDLLLFNLFSTILKPVMAVVYVTLSTIGARICSGIFNYTVNRWIFSSKTKVSSSGPKYLILWAVQMALSAALVTGICYLIKPYQLDRITALFASKIQGETVIKLVIDSILFVISFFVQKKWVFADKKEK